MTTPQQPAPNQRLGYQGSLARSLFQTLFILTFIPLILMGGSAYLRARALLRDQVNSQMQTQMTNQLEQVDLGIKTKEIRLDHLVRSQDFRSLIFTAFSTDQQSTYFQTLRQNISLEVGNLGAAEGKATFNQFLIMRPDGIIQIASKPEWDGLDLSKTPYFKNISDSNQQSFVAYDLAPLFPQQLILLTIVQFEGINNAHIGTVIGITEPQSLQEILLSLRNINPSANAYFVTPTQTFVGTDPYTNQLVTFNSSQEQNAQLSATLNSLMSSDSSVPQSLEFTATNNQPVLAETTWLSSIKAGIVLEIPQNVIYGQLNSLIPFTLLIFLLALLAMGLVIWVGTNQIFRPLASLTEITRRFSEGDFSQRAPVRSRDEIGLLAHSFNQMAEELSGLYQSLEQKVDERTRQIRTAAEVAQRVTSTTNLDDLLNRTVELIVEQFNFYHASIFMLDRGGKYALLRSAHGPVAKEMLERGHRLEVGSASIIGWVSANNQPRIASDVAEDPIHLKNELLPETKSEAGIPISVGGLVLGVLDVQSTQAGAFGPETIVMLQTLASQIAVAIQNVDLVESTQINLQELERLYRASRQIAAAQTETDAFQEAWRVLKDSPYSTALLTARNKHLVLVASNSQDELGSLHIAIGNLEPDLGEIETFLSGSPVIIEAKSTNMPAALTRFPREMGYQSLAYIPILRHEDLAGLIVIGGRQQVLTSAVIQPYANMTNLISATLEKIEETELQIKQLSEREALASLSQTISVATTDLGTFFTALHKQVREIIGDFAFIIALYDKTTESINIPYMYEEGRVDKIEAFPLGEGLSSILIRSGQPLLLVENTESRAAELGAKVIGKPARSWMGAPMIVQNEPIGALIIQDLEHEHAFNEDNLRFFTALANQVAGVIYNVRLLEESRGRALQLETAAEIARDISGSLNLDEVLEKAVNFLRERFNFYHAAIFLIDPLAEFAIIREASGEAGAQMKRTGHKLGVGSKSIVGYVAGRGEFLIVNDITKDATYYANPLLPETRSEAAIPLKIGERILGVLDVQSIHAYAFTQDNMRTLQILADQMAVAVVNSELYAETQEHLSQHRLLYHITTTAASGTTLEEALESAVKGLQVTLGGDRVTILLMDREQRVLEVKASIGYSEDINKVRVPMGTGITGWAAAHRRPLRISDAAGDPRYIQVSPNTRSELAVPLIYRNEVLGVLNVESEQTGAYTENDEEMLGTLGGSLAAVIANARLVEQIRYQAERERLLYEVTSKIRRSTDIQTIMATTASELTKAVGANRVKIKIRPEEVESSVAKPHES